MSESTNETTFRAAREGFHWDGVETRRYKDEPNAPYREVTRQILFSDPRLKGELRYFEVAPGGYTTLEKHEHMHAVLVLRGGGACLIGDDVRALKLNDLVTVPPWTWHQFRAGKDEPLGFLCLVNAERDRPQLPSDSELAEMKRDPTVRAFLEGK
ncbi:MAG TPA: cupin domain-containing protein [Roseiarcus sp.]|nr:cupin domain-containing protein [Roseiarcus sp.]